ncbi:MAG: sigma-70 family RNA polymerase sigma factor [Anaerolineales bacterium]|nr:sigma-70 family RNA polymerase sigma factor [Anaerolineales bacterium]
MAMTLPKSNKVTLQASREAIDFEVLFQEHWNRVCGNLFRLVVDWDEAQDLALDTFEQLYRRPPKDDTNLSGWLYRVATNRGLNALRARERRAQYEQKAGSLTLEEDQPEDPADVLERKQEQTRVRTTLGLMKPRSAQLLILRHAGLSYAEIASTLEVSPNSVGTLLVRAEREFEEQYS